MQRMRRANGLETNTEDASAVAPLQAKMLALQTACAEVLESQANGIAPEAAQGELLNQLAKLQEQLAAVRHCVQSSGATPRATGPASAAARRQRASGERQQRGYGACLPV